MTAITRAVGRLLVTGAGGFVGKHVALKVEDGRFGATEFMRAPAGLDIRDSESVNRLIAEYRPDSILHLAAQSFVPRSFEVPLETYEINLLGTLNLLTSMKEHGFSGRFLYVSSGDVYGRVPDDAMPINERRIPEPRSPYAASKIAAEQLCLAWHRAEGLDVVIARPFNHVGPGQDPKFVIPSLARQVVSIASYGKAPMIDVGDVDVTRDFTDVRDVVEAYAAMFQLGQSGTTYLVASGVERSVRGIIDELCSLAGIRAEIRQDPGKLRPAEQRRVVASSELLRTHTGWEPRIPFEMTLQSILDDMRTTL